MGQTKATEPAEFLRGWLSEDERRYLAMHATYEAGKQDDPRYCAATFEEREQLRTRWREIADALHVDPWDARKLCGSCDHSRGQHDVRGCNDCDCVASWGDDQP